MTASPRKCHKNLSPDADFMRRVFCIYGGMYDTKVTPYPVTSCNDPDAEYTPNLPDFEESLNDYLLREVHQADIDARQVALNNLTEKEISNADSFASLAEEKVVLGERLKRRDENGLSYDAQAEKRRVEIEIKRRQTKERRRREAIERRIINDKDALRRMKEEIKKENALKERKDREERERRQLYGKARAEELLRKKEENDKRRKEEEALQRAASKEVQRLSKTSKPLEVTDDLKKPDPKKEAEEKRRRMMESARISREHNMSSTTPRSPRQLQKFSLR